MLGVVDAMGIQTYHIVFGDRGSIPGWMLTALSPERVLTAVSENVSHINGFLSAGLQQSRMSWYML
ncbi:MAG TPA: hypothetical protein DDW52_28750 [Planctomycetaceae bacterium]|nr:hypothetical protein [Planctomycetaceae bacterium]